MVSPPFPPFPSSTYIDNNRHSPDIVYLSASKRVVILLLFFFRILSIDMYLEILTGNGIDGWTDGRKDERMDGWPRIGQQRTVVGVG